MSDEDDIYITFDFITGIRLGPGNLGKRNNNDKLFFSSNKYIRRQMMSWKATEK